MKSITRVILLAFSISISQFLFSVNNSGYHVSIVDADETYDYAFSIGGIATYADAKPIYKFIEETFSKRPSFNDETGKFVISDSPILISEVELTNRLNQVELSLTSFQMLTADHYQNK